MKFYEFNGDFPYTAIIYAKNKEEALKIYQEQVCELDKEELSLMPRIVDVDVIAKEIREDATKGNFPELDDAKIHGIGNWFFDILTAEEPFVVFIDSNLL